VNEKGDLLLGSGDEQVRFEKPVVYQELAGDKKQVEGSYALASANRIGFQLGEYDHSRPLVIDPVLSYSTYLGGSGGDNSNGIAVDASENAYVTGGTQSTNFPTASALQSTLRGAENIFVAKISSDNIPPTTTAIPSPGPNGNGWNNTSVTVELNATDNPGGSGVKQIQYALSGSENIGLQTVAGNVAPVPISAEGITTLTYFAEDNAGNQETSKTLTVRIDETPPVISGLPVQGCTIWPPNHKLVQVATVTAADGLSGPAPSSFSVTGDQQRSGRWSNRNHRWPKSISCPARCR
jgi:hypothetical protein